jgi:glycogen synthase
MAPAPVHVLWLTENFPPSRGGMAQSCDRITYGLRQKGFIIHIIHFSSRREPFKTEILVNGTYTAVPVSENEAHTSNLCWNHINRMPYHFNKIVAFGGFLPLLTGPVFSKWLHVPLVTLLRGNDFDTAVFSPRRNYLLKEAMLTSGAVGCVTQDQFQKVLSLFPGTPAWYLPNGINTENWKLLPSEKKFGEEWRTKLNNKLCLGVFGQVKEKKGIEVLLNVLQKPGNHDYFFLLIAGDYHESLAPVLTGSGIEYELLPFLDRNELVRYYGVCDAVVIPSHYEGMPNVLLEAGALGIPVIGSDVGGMKDILAKFREDLLFYPGDADQLESLLFKFYSRTGGEREFLGRQLKEHINENYNDQNELKPYTEILQYDATRA